MKSHTKTFVALLVTMFLLSGCKETLSLSLSSADEKIPAPRFRVEDPARPGARPLYDTVKLSDAAGQILWHLRAEPFGVDNSVETIAYATTPQGFTVVIAPKPLEPNQDYILGVIGEAFGTLRFHVDANGQVQSVK